MMKRKLVSLLAFITAMACAFGLTACEALSGLLGGSEENSSLEESLVASVESATETMVVIKVENAEEETMLIDVLGSLKAEKKLTYESQSSQYGEYITSVNGKEEMTTTTLTGSEGYSWMVYTSDASVANTEQVIPETEYYSSMNGVSMLEVKEGHSYVLYYEYWSYSF